MNCPICKNPTKLFSKRNNFLIFKCLSCGFGLTKNLTEQEGDYHRDEEYIEEEKLFENIFLKRVKIIERFLKTGKVLEVGCSTGLMLSLLKKKGWEVQGIEISKKAASVAIKRGVKVSTIPFEKINEMGKFDLIVFNHTLEHLKDPISTLKKAKKLLKPKGLLYIDLPNFESLSAKVWKGRWNLLLPDEHLWHFTEKSFKKTFKDLDFKLIYIEKASGIWDFASPLSEITVSLFSFKKRFFKELISALPSLLISKFGLGSDLMIIARKK